MIAIQEPIGASIGITKENTTTYIVAYIRVS
jgi:hypothetical protein